MKTGLAIKNHVWDLTWCWKWTFFDWFFLANLSKNAKNNFSSESVKTKEHKESNSCDKYHFSINAFYKINLWPILKKLLQKIDFHHFPLFEIIAQYKNAKKKPDVSAVALCFSNCGWDWEYTVQLEVMRWNIHRTTRWK